MLDDDGCGGMVFVALVVLLAGIPFFHALVAAILADVGHAGGNCGFPA